MTTRYSIIHHRKSYMWIIMEFIDSCRKMAVVFYGA